MKPMLLIILITSISFASLLPRLLRVEASSEEVSPGDRIYLLWEFQNVGGEDEENYMIFVHARLKGTDEGFGGDFKPFHPTSCWRKGEIVRETSILNIPADAKKGDYVLYVGFYSKDKRIEMDNKEIEREGLRYEVFSFRVGEKREAKRIIKELKNALKLEGKSIYGKGLNLENDYLKVELMSNYPVIRSIEGKKIGEIFRGANEEDFQLELMTPEGKIVYAPSSFYLIFIESKKQEGKVGYEINVKKEGKSVLYLELWYELKGESLVAGWGNLKSEGYKLVSLRLPLISLSGGKLALPLLEGRLVDSKKSFPHREIIGIDCWRSPITYSSLSGKNGTALLELKSVEDRVLAEVNDGKGALGVIFNCHSATNPPLLLQSSSQAIVHFIKGNWLQSAHFVWENINDGVRDIYKNSIVYKIFCDVPQAEKPVTTFSEAFEIIKKFYNLTQGMRQIVYLVGWQFRGHDTGYPAIDQVNERLGGREGLLRLIEDARRFNAIVSFHDNYDDAYMDSPAWNDDFICRTPNGELVKGGVWAGGQSYIINPKRYVEGGYAEKRIKQTLSLYPIRESYHIDVLSAVPLRYSYSLHTCTGSESVFYKKRIVEMFRDRGVDVTSELVTQPFLGFLSYFWHLSSSYDGFSWLERKFFSDEENIPFVPACIHGKAIYGSRGYLGGVGRMDVTPGNWRDFLRLLFLETFPSLLFVDQRIEDYRDGKIIYREGWWSSDDQVFYRGRLVRKGGDVFLPRNSEEWLAYSDQGGVVEWELPDGWKGVEIYRLYEDGRKKRVDCELKGGKFRFEAEAQGVYEVRKREN
ncbi:hypothetical protein H5T87_01210 [bacterium]|nr:hypothetical protein [bacterium]